MLIAAACSRARAGGEHGGAEGLRLVPVVSGLRDPVHLLAPAGDPRLFVVEQDGRIRVVKDGRLLPKPFLDIEGRVGSGGERGLLSVAFHPRFAENGRFYVNYTDRHGDTRVERYLARPGADTADRASAALVITIPQPYANHNGGLVAFGLDDMLYVGMGDGGSENDPHHNGQDSTTLLSKLLRLDVDRGEPYRVPSDNPFVHSAGGRPEIWATGLRNPWRFAFDRETGLLYIADVGQNLWEEVDVAPAREAGLNYGWSRMDSAHCFRALMCNRAGLVLPALEYSHLGGCAVIGGYVYRGHRMPALAGHYFYSDFCGGWLKSFRYQNGRVVERTTWQVPNVGSVLSFGEDADGELYVLTGGGVVYRIEPAR